MTDKEMKEEMERQKRKTCLNMLKITRGMVKKWKKSDKGLIAFNSIILDNI